MVNTLGLLLTVTETGAMLDRIEDSANQIRDMNAQIAAATEEQSMVIETVNRSVVEVKDLADGTNNLAPELGSRFSKLGNMSRQMVEQVAILKT